MTKPLIAITGASSGIGKATAEIFAAQGFPLLLMARRVERLEAMQLPNTICAKVDVTNLDNFRAVIEKAEQQYGPIDCLINNAGVMLLGLSHEQDPKEWQTMLDVNVMGLLNGIHLVADKMKQRRSGTIINISSVAGRKTFPNHAIYCGTKFAVHAISDEIRAELANDNVRVVTIAPGAVETELLSHTTAEKIKENYQNWKEEIGGAIAAEDVANAIVYAYQQPQNLCVREIVLAATGQQS